MTDPTRFPNGVSNANLNTVFADMGLLDPSKFHKYENDFDTYIAANWTITSVGAATRALANEDGGALLITNAAADDDSSFLNKKGESFKFVAGKKLAFKARFKISEVLQSDMIIGLQITDTTPLDVTDGVFFQKSDGSANLDFVVEKNNVATTKSAIKALVDDTYVSVGFIYNGVDKIDFFVDDERLGTSVLTNLPDDEELTISFGIQNGEAVAKTMSIDYINVIKER